MTRPFAPPIADVRADLAQRVVVLSDDLTWVSSPSEGVERAMLDRRGGEDGRATSFVRYRPDAAFRGHEHGGGEEFFVLEGLFIDEHGQYPAGTYVRNPAGSAHAPRAGSEGATLFVKLRQIAAHDARRVVIATSSSTWSPGAAPGLEVLPLHEHGDERVALVRWAPDTRFHRHGHWGGEEILVLDGALRDEHGTYPAGTWLRSPHRSVHAPLAGAEGATILVKTGHLLGAPA